VADADVLELDGRASKDVDRAPRVSRHKAVNECAVRNAKRRWRVARRGCVRGPVECLGADDRNAPRCGLDVTCIDGDARATKGSDLRQRLGPRSELRLFVEDTLRDPHLRPDTLGLERVLKTAHLDALQCNLAAVNGVDTVGRPVRVRRHGGPLEDRSGRGERRPVSHFRPTSWAVDVGTVEGDRRRASVDEKCHLRRTDQRQRLEG
jgi:hypothetical protein